MRAIVLVACATLVVVACAGDGTQPPTNASVPIVTTSSTTTTTVASPSNTAADGSVVDSTTTTTAPPAPLASLEVDVVPVADDFDQPILPTTRAGDDRLIVADQPGVVYAVDLGTGERSVLLDIESRVRFSGEQGLLGIAFRPDDAALMIVHYSATDGTTTVSEFDIASDDPADTERVILTERQPASNHNGGMIAFGPDGFLYIGLGDGGGADDQFDQAQDPTTRLGTILRIAVGGPEPYAVPEDNPFVGSDEGASEVWAYGLRNPWRFAFDGTDLWVGDVGQGTIEEINRFEVGRPGANAGWSLLEGSDCFRVDPCDFDGLLTPVAEYRHQAGRCSVTGGVVYRGSAIPDLVGAYLYGDYCTGEVWALRGDEQRLLTDAGDVFLPPLSGLTSFGIGPDGEVYLAQAGGLVWRLVQA